MPRTLARLPIVAALLTGAFAAACGEGPTTPQSCEETNTCNDTTPVFQPTCPTVNASSPVGRPETFDVGTWNLLWFGSTTAGPSNEVMQQTCVRQVIDSAGLDLWGVQEVAGAAAFSQLVDSLDGYSGLLANDPSVSGGREFYSDDELKVGLIWKSEHLVAGEARIVLQDYNFEFAGRPPLEVQATLTMGDTTKSVVVLVLHAKASAGRADYDRRQAAAVALKGYLDSTWPDSEVLVLGDFNDDVDVSIVAGLDSPYKDFVDAVGDWRFVTDTLSATGENSFVTRFDMIDHILVSGEVEEHLVYGSAAVYRPATNETAYAGVVSDHWPVIARFRPRD